MEKEKLRVAEKKNEADEVISKLKDLKEIWHKYNINRVYLHGSFADLTFNKYSDIDIAIEAHIDFETLLKLYCEINRYFEIVAEKAKKLKKLYKRDINKFLNFREKFLNEK